ncbi:MAG: intermembrane transport protein PqiB [Pantoea sp.]|uniref:intermembrane transport protein PqiB n=1 Tax=Pantoea sp. TaxID=69393 RepID=UPI00238A9518|nr:intermembrane transport protein PqiB [Pantoea sp.]MDE1186332.1 intermembrane transport protein PqiB [Pantoea sp.]
MENNAETTPVNKIKRWSPVWFFPFITLVIGAWIIYYHFSHQGPEITLITDNAEGIEGGKTEIKSRSITVGQVESTVLSDDLQHVEIKARLHEGMETLLHGDSLFWVVKPQVGFQGVSGLGTLLSGAYIELQPGTEGQEPPSYALTDTPPPAAANAPGIRVTLFSEKAGQLKAGDPVLFRHYPVGTVESNHFDTDKRLMSYQLFISAPFDRLVTTNVRFWKDSGIAIDMSAAGLRVEMSSLTTLLSGGVSFDVPDGLPYGSPAKNKAEYPLFNDQHSIQDSLYTEHVDYLLFFNSSVRGLEAGAPVEFRGLRVGTVAQVPFFLPGVVQDLQRNYRPPLLIRIEPERFVSSMGTNFNLQQRLQEAKKNGLRATLKTGSLISGSLYVDLDFYPQAEPYTGLTTLAGYEIIPTMDSGLGQIQQKLVAVLDKLNTLPLNPLLTQATDTFKASQLTLRESQTALHNLNLFMGSEAMKSLPEQTQQTLRELSRNMRSLQPGSPAYEKMVANMQRLDQVLRELQPVLKTLNNKSNALVIAPAVVQDPQPKAIQSNIPHHAQH